MTETKTLTGRHVALIFCGCFSVIIGVNLALAYNAVKTFPGLEVKNSYVASQVFDENRAAQEALGWTVSAQALADEVVLSVTDTAGKPVELAALSATLGRATHVRDDQIPDFRFDGARYIAKATLGPGNWNLRMVATSDDGTTFQQRIVLHIQKPKK
jgi:nitrogen fixation protein FixH